jgi:hypothetical protein
VSLWPQVFLGLIAVTSLTTAIVQVCVLIAAARLGRRVERLVDRIENELTPVFGQIDAISRDTSRAIALATMQIERVDGLISDLVRQAATAVSVVRNTAAIPAREGKAVLTALMVVFDVFREARRRSRTRRRGEEDDVLFI